MIFQGFYRVWHYWSSTPTTDALAAVPANAEHALFAHKGPSVPSLTTGSKSFTVFICIAIPTGVSSSYAMDKHIRKRTLSSSLLNYSCALPPQSWTLPANEHWGQKLWGISHQAPAQFVHCHPHGATDNGSALGFKAWGLILVFYNLTTELKDGEKQRVCWPKASVTMRGDLFFS